MVDYKLEIELLSDATFGRGDGIAGMVDQEVEHDADGLPIIYGRTIKGLLVDACAEILYGLGKPMDSGLGEMAAWLFGSPGSGLGTTGRLHVGTGQIAGEVSDYFRQQVQNGALTPTEILTAWTAIRRQTAMDEHDVPRDHSLRSERVVIRSTKFVSHLHFSKKPDDSHLQLLAACAAGVKRGGSGRTRGRGRLKVSLVKESETVSFDGLFQGASQ